VGFFFSPFTRQDRVDNDFTWGGWGGGDISSNAISADNRPQGLLGSPNSEYPYPNWYILFDAPEPMETTVSEAPPEIDTGPFSDPEFDEWIEL